ALWVQRRLVGPGAVRGRIHVLPADARRGWVGALGTRRYWESKEWLERERLTAKEATAIFDTVHAALGENGSTRAEIVDAVVARLGAKFRPKISSGWGQLLAPRM